MCLSFIFNFRQKKFLTVICECHWCLLVAKFAIILSCVSYSHACMMQVFKNKAKHTRIQNKHVITGGSFKVPVVAIIIIFLLGAAPALQFTLCSIKLLQLCCIIEQIIQYSTAPPQLQLALLVAKLGNHFMNSVEAYGLLQTLVDMLHAQMHCLIKNVFFGVGNFQIRAFLL